MEGLRAWSPVYELEFWNRTHWDGAGPGWCGMGMRQLLLAPSEPVDFSVAVSERRGPIRVGVRYLVSRADRGREVWSSEVPLPEQHDKDAIVITPDVTPPELPERVEPVYPEVLVRAGIEGKVVLKVVVDELGRVNGVEVVQSPNPLFDDAAVTAITGWRYKPAMKDGHPVKVILRIIVKFEIPGKETANTGP